MHAIDIAMSTLYLPAAWFAHVNNFSFGHTRNIGLTF